jgi:Spy/CpxP family protein refolding chaperone
MFALGNYSPVYSGFEKWGDETGQWEARISQVHKEIGVSEEQEARLMAHRQAHRAKVKEIYQMIKEKKELIREELQNTDYDINQIMKTHRELKLLKTQLEDSRLEGILAVRNILTADQFKKLMAIKEEWKTKESMSHKGSMKGEVE